MELDLLLSAREQLWEHLKQNPDDVDSLEAYQQLNELIRNPLKGDFKRVEDEDGKDEGGEDEGGEDEKKEKIELCEFCKRRIDYTQTYSRTKS